MTPCPHAVKVSPHSSNHLLATAQNNAVSLTNRTANIDLTITVITHYFIKLLIFNINVPLLLMGKDLRI
jgi:hypothetical protein